MASDNARQDEMINRLFAETLKNFMDKRTRPALTLCEPAIKGLMSSACAEVSQNLEHSRYDWFQAAQAAEKRVEVLEGLLLDTKSVLASELSCELFAKMASHIKRIEAALSSSAEPSVKMVRAHKHTCANVQPGSTIADVCDCGAMADGTPVPVERDERAEFEAAYEADANSDVHEVRTTRQIAWVFWQARAALDKSTEGAEPRLRK